MPTWEFVDEIQNFIPAAREGKEEIDGTNLAVGSDPRTISGRTN